MLAALTLGLVAIATAIIGTAVLWGHRNRTLHESDQERFDRRFAEIVRAEGDAG